jgi:colicin import membrane protein
MTATTRHIEDLSVEAWATLTRRAAVEAVAAAERRGKKPPPELVAIAAMTERQLVERRERNGPARQRLSPLMQLVDADHMRRMAEARARDAHQDKLDAEAAAAAARVEADESSRMASAARAQVRTAQQRVAEQDVERTTERAAAAEAHERSLQQLRAEVEKVRADAEAEIAAARERVAAAEDRAKQRATERTTASEAAEQAMQQLRAEFEQVRADAEAVIAAARERTAAAEERAKQRTAERTAASEAAEQAVQQLRRELERVRADADAEIAASRGWAAGEAAAAQEAAQGEVARAYAAADEAIRQAQTQAARTSAMQPLSIPIPPFEFRSATGHIENALNALQRIDYMLEVDMADEGGSDIQIDVELMQTLAWIVQDHAKYLCNESQSAVSGMPPPIRDEAAVYAEVAADAFRALLQRIEAAARRLGGRHRSPDAEISNFITAMLVDPWVQRARELDSRAP